MSAIVKLFENDNPRSGLGDRMKDLRSLNRVQEREFDERNAIDCKVKMSRTNGEDDCVCVGRSVGVEGSKNPTEESDSSKSRILVSGEECMSGGV